MKNFLILSSLILSSLSFADSQQTCEATVEKPSYSQSFHLNFTLDPENTSGIFDLATFVARPYKHLIPHFYRGRLTIVASKPFQTTYALLDSQLPEHELFSSQSAQIGILIINTYVGTFTLHLKNGEPVQLDCR